MVFKSLISSGGAIANPRRAPAMERDLENVCVTIRFGSSFVSLTADSAPKSTYASSTVTILSGFDSAIFLISSSVMQIPVGAFGFAIIILLSLLQ